jgi:predicted dehydrogenase
MTTRRSFIKKAGAGAALTTVAFSSASALASSLTTQQISQKPIRIGIIGAENSHTLGYARMFNIDIKFPGVTVTHVWGEKDEYAKTASEKGKIPNIVKDPNDMLGKIDALIVDHRHAKYHLEPAIPFIKAKIPTFIDKPFCYRVSEGKEFLALARSVGTPVSSYSTSAYSEETLDLKKQMEEIGKINHFISYSPVDIDSPWGGVFFYGCHALDMVLAIFGDDVSRVRVTRNGKNAVASLALGNGTLVTMIFLKMTYAFANYIETKKGIIELKSTIKEADPNKAYRDMVEMFRTGVEPRKHESILYSTAVLEALERSVADETWQYVVA